MAPDIASRYLSTESPSLPLAAAITAWLFSLGFCVWLVTQLGFERRTAGFWDAVWLLWFCAIQGAFAAAASLFLIRLRNRAQLPIVGRSIARYLAAALLAIAAVSSVLVVTNG